jgi:integrase
MTRYNPDNERIKRQYFRYLKEAARYSETTVTQVAQALARFEADSGYRDFRTFNPELAVAFKRRLATQVKPSGRGPLSKATLYATLAHLKRFFHWLAGQPGFRSRLSYSHADYFNLTAKESRVATTRRERPFPTLEQVRQVILAMPAGTVIERRDRAVVAFTLLTGARDSAIASLKLKHIDLVEGRVYQDARDVNTKNSKSFVTFFFPVGGDILQIFTDWVNHLRSELLWGNEEPVFPTTAVAVGSNSQFQATGLKREHWRSASPIRAIFKEAFAAVQLPYFNPHSLRKTLVQFAETVCRSPEEFKAWSQNLGHEKVLTTFQSYGAVANRRQGEIIRGLGREADDMPDEILLAALSKRLHLARLDDGGGDAAGSASGPSTTVRR